MGIGHGQRDVPLLALGGQGLLHGAVVPDRPPLQPVLGDDAADHLRILHLGDDDVRQLAKKIHGHGSVGQGMVGADRPHHPLLEQARLLEAVGRAHETGDGHIRPAGVQRLHQRRAGIADANLRVRGRLSQPRDHLRQDDGGDIRARFEGEASVGGQRVEIGGRKGGLKLAQPPQHAWRDLAGVGGGAHPVRPAHEQLVAQGVAQAVERMAHGGLGQAETLGGAGDAPLLEQGFEHPY